MEKSRKQLKKLASHVEGLVSNECECVVLAGDFNLDLRKNALDRDGGARLAKCGLRRVVPVDDPGTTLDAVKMEPGGVIDQVWLHASLSEGVTKPSASVVCFDEELVGLAARRQPPVSRRWLIEGLRLFDGCNGGTAAGGMRRLGWPDHRSLIVDLWAKCRYAVGPAPA